MYCDNREFMFGRDFVNCVMRKLCPRWMEPHDFQYGATKGSPFISSFREVVELLIENNTYSWDKFCEELEMPSTILTFIDYLKELTEKFFEDNPYCLHQQLNFFLTISTMAACCFNNGIPDDYHIIAADLITKFIFRLRKEATLVLLKSEMYCDNREFMFARDFVNCAMRKLCPRWSEPRDFRYGTTNGSPFTCKFQEAVESLMEKNYLSWDSFCEETGKPLTILTFTEFSKELPKIFLGVEPYCLSRQLKLFFAASTLAAYFFNNGSPDDYHIIAADIITKFIFRLRKEGMFDETTWIQYESLIGKLQSPKQS